MSTVQRDVLERIAALQAQLSDLKEQFASEPILYEVYSQSASYELQLLREKVRSALAEVDDTADMWVGLRGEGFGFGTGPMEVVANFLTNLRIATKHAASALRGVSHTGGRFLREIESAAAFDVVATAPGSLRIGLAHSVGEIPVASESDLFGDDLIAESITQAEEQSRLGMDALQVLVLALDAANDDGALFALREKLADHGTLRVLYHARSLFPFGVSAVEFRGRAVRGTRTYPSDTKEALKRLSERLVQAERYVSGIGVLRMLDLDRQTLRLDFARIDSLAGVDTVNCDFDDSFVSRLSELMNEPVGFSGFLAFDAKGTPQRVRIDSLESVELSHIPIQA